MKTYNYRYERDETGMFQVRENRTGNIIKSGMLYEFARELARTLERGAGFDGWTPYFAAEKSPASVFL